MATGGRGSDITPSVLYKDSRLTFEDIWTASPKMREAIERARLAAPHNVDVLIVGETGTGKNLVAQAIHNASPRGRGPESFVAVNIAAIPDTLLAAELFGTEEGAYTGAKARAGYFEQADGGTLFLDEIGDLSAECQARILTAVEAKRVQRLGGTKTTDCDVRIVSATNADLKKAIDGGAFRLDLYHRLSRLEIPLPPLRERREDIEMLAQRFTERASVEFGRQVMAISSACLNFMLDYPWPGNVRELRGRIDAAMITCSGTELRTEDLFPDSLKSLSDGTPPEQEFALETVERRHIQKVLDLTDGNITRTAELLGITRPTVYDRIRKYGLSVPSKSAPTDDGL